MSEKELSKLQAKRDRLRKELAKYQSTQTSDEQRKIEIMELLHRYNEIKDGTQIIIGALANIDNITIKSVHEKFNLPMD